jgi:hypothetical protein
MTNGLPSYSLFQDEWWLEATAPGRWAEALVRNGDEILARMPFVRKRKMGFQIITMPPLTQSLGPWVRPSTAKYSTRLSDETELLTELIAQLPPHVAFRQRFSPLATNWLPFHWKGYDARPVYTYCIDEMGDPDRIWSEFRKGTKSDVKKANGVVEVRDIDLDRFIRFLGQFGKGAGQQVARDPELLRRIDRSAVQREARLLTGAFDVVGNLQAAAYVVWDSRRAYYLLGASDPALRHTGAFSLVMWESIRALSGRTAVFDFEGSMLRPVELHFRGYGARQTLCLVVSKIPRPLRVFVT